MLLQGDPRKYQTYLATRPKSFEANAVALLIDVLRQSKHQPMKPGFWLHIVHLANADLLADIKQAQDEGASAGVAPQKLMHSSYKIFKHIIYICTCIVCS